MRETLGLYLFLRGLACAVWGQGHPPCARRRTESQTGLRSAGFRRHLFSLFSTLRGSVVAGSLSTHALSASLILFTLSLFAFSLSSLRPLFLRLVVLSLLAFLSLCCVTPHTFVQHTQCPLSGIRHWPILFSFSLFLL